MCILYLLSVYNKLYVYIVSVERVQYSVCKIVYMLSVYNIVYVYCVYVERVQYSVCILCIC